MFKVVLIKGDGIGPEIADSVVEIFNAAKVPITWIEKLRLFDGELGYTKAQGE